MQVPVVVYVHQSLSTPQAAALVSEATVRARQDLINRKCAGISFYRTPRGSGDFGAPAFVVRHLRSTIAPVVRLAIGLECGCGAGPALDLALVFDIW